MMSSTKSPNELSRLGLIFVLSLIFFFSGCAAPLSERTCTSIQGVSLRIISDRQSGLSMREAIDKLSLFTVGKPDSKYFFGVASQIIEAAYMEPTGTSEAEKDEIAKSFVARMHQKCLLGDLNPSYGPAIRVLPAIQ